MSKSRNITLKDEPSRLVDVQYAAGEEQINSFRRNEKAEPKHKQCTVANVSAVESKVQWCKYCIAIWNIRSMNQGKLVVVKQEMARMNIKILGISKVKWIRMGELNLEGHYICYTEQEPLRRNGIVLIVNKGV